MTTEATRYEIRIEGALSADWSSWFGGLQVVSDGRQTIITGVITDQPTLYGVLDQIRDLGISLISVRRTESRLPPA